jgi:hypothetical protein
MLIKGFIYKAGLLKYLTLRVVMFAILVYAFAHEAGAAEVTITTYGTDVVFNGETLRGTDNGSPMTFTFDTKHMSKVVNHLDDKNTTLHHGDEDIVYAGTNITGMGLDANPEHIVFVVKFLDGPIVLYQKLNGASGYSVNGIDMPPWGGVYYEAAARLYKEFLKGT